MHATPSPETRLRTALAELDAAHPSGLARVRARVEAADASGALLAGILDLPSAREEALLWLLNTEMEPSRPLTAQDVACHAITWTTGILDERFTLAEMERPAARMDPQTDIAAADVWRWLRVRSPKHPTVRTLAQVLLRNARPQAHSAHGDTTLEASRRRPPSTLWVKAGHLLDAPAAAATSIALDTPRRIARFMDCAKAAGIFTEQGRLVQAAPRRGRLRWPPTLTSLGLTARPHTCLGVFLPHQAWPVLALALRSEEVEDCLAAPMEASLSARRPPRRARTKSPPPADERRLSLTLDDIMQGDAEARIIHWDDARLAAAGMQVSPALQEILQPAQ